MTRNIVLIAILSFAGITFSLEALASSSAKANDVSPACEKIEFWAQHNEVEFVKGKPVLKFLAPKKLDLSLSKDGQLPARLLVRKSENSKNTVTVRVESNEKKPRNVGSYSLIESKEHKGFYEITNFESQRVFESVDLEDRLLFEFPTSDKGTCVKTFSYNTDHGDH